MMTPIQQTNGGERPAPYPTMLAPALQQPRHEHFPPVTQAQLKLQSQPPESARDQVSLSPAQASSHLPKSVAFVPNFQMGKAHWLYFMSVKLSAVSMLANRAIEPLMKHIAQKKTRTALDNRIMAVLQHQPKAVQHGLTLFSVLAIVPFLLADPAYRKGQDRLQQSPEDWQRSAKIKALAGSVLSIPFWITAVQGFRGKLAFGKGLAPVLLDFVGAIGLTLLWTAWLDWQRSKKK